MSSSSPIARSLPQSAFPNIPSQVDPNSTSAKITSASELCFSGLKDFQMAQTRTCASIKVLSKKLSNGVVAVDIKHLERQYMPFVREIIQHEFIAKLPLPYTIVNHEKAVFSLACFLTDKNKPDFINKPFYLIQFLSRADFRDKSFRILIGFFGEHLKETIVNLEEKFKVNPERKQLALDAYEMIKISESFRGMEESEFEKFSKIDWVNLGFQSTKLDSINKAINALVAYLLGVPLSEIPQRNKSGVSKIRCHCTYPKTLSVLSNHPELFKTILKIIFKHEIRAITLKSEAVMIGLKTCYDKNPALGKFNPSEFLEEEPEHLLPNKRKIDTENQAAPAAKRQKKDVQKAVESPDLNSRGGAKLISPAASSLHFHLTKWLQFKATQSQNIVEISFAGSIFNVYSNQTVVSCFYNLIKTELKNAELKSNPNIVTLVHFLIDRAEYEYPMKLFYLEGRFSSLEDFVIKFSTSLPEVVKSIEKIFPVVEKRKQHIMRIYERCQNLESSNLATEVASPENFDIPLVRIKELDESTLQTDASEALPFNLDFMDFGLLG